MNLTIYDDDILIVCAHKEYLCKVKAKCRRGLFDTIDVGELGLFLNVHDMAYMLWGC